MLTWLGGVLIFAVFVHIGFLAHVGRLSAPGIFTYGVIACVAGATIANLASIHDVVMSVGATNQLHFTMSQIETKAAEVEQIATHVQALATRIEEANEKAERERAARLGIEEQLADRVLSEEQGKSIASKLTKFAGIVVGIVPCTNNREVVGFAAEIGEALEAAQMKPLTTFSVQGVATKGVVVCIANDSSQVMHDAANGIIEALKAEKIRIDPVLYPKPDPSSFVMGTKEVGDAPIWVVVGDRA
jgi:hypothetical protein